MKSTAGEQVKHIVELVRHLSPAQRRLLQRRLQVSGLWDATTLLTDQNRLEVAPALGNPQTRPQRGEAGEPRTLVSPRPTETPPPKLAAPARGQNQLVTPAAEYHSPIRGHIVVAAPQDDAPVAPQESDPHLMSPLPGQAPEQPIHIVFDGGSKGNPGRGYGSYAIDWPGQPQQIIRPQFGDNVTNNEAEYDTLIAALETVLKKLHDQGADASSATVNIRGDSLLVINQVLDAWKCNEDRLRVRRDRARSLLQRFGSSKLTHHGRENSVRVLGH